MQIIPAIDIRDGKVVRLTEGDYNQMSVYKNTPLDTAKMFEDAGLKNVHIVDLDGARLGKIVNYKIIEQIAAKTNLKIDTGGGLKTHEDVRIVFECGAHQINVGTLAVKNKSLFLEWLNFYGTEKVILSADVRDERIAVSGWEEATKIDLFDFLNDYISQGLKYCVCTDISKDGKLQGVSIDLYKKILEQFPTLQLVASGGVKDVTDIENAQKINCYGIIIGKALYENRISLKTLVHYQN